jgi:hypothetical protein
MFGSARLGQEQLSATKSKFVAVLDDDESDGQKSEVAMCGQSSARRMSVTQAAGVAETRLTVMFLSAS